VFLLDVEVFQALLRDFETRDVVVTDNVLRFARRVFDNYVNKEFDRRLKSD